MSTHCELFGSELHDAGYGYAACGDAWLDAVAGLRRDLGRDPTAFERAAFGRGFVEGERDLAAWEADQERHECFEASVSLERAGPAWDESPL